MAIDIILFLERFVLSHGIIRRTYNAGQSNQEGYHVVGPLECWGDPPAEEQGIPGISYDIFYRFGCGIHDFNQK